MTASVSVAPPNSLLLIAEAPTSTGPKATRAASGIAATPSCIGVGCLMFLDGETKVTLGRSAPKWWSSGVRRISRYAASQGGRMDHRVDKLLEASVPTTRTRIRVWTNHPTEPDDIYIGVGEAA
jgi:hypothetical protein